MTKKIYLVCLNMLFRDRCFDFGGTMETGVFFILFLCAFCVRVTEEKLFIKYSNVCVPPKGDICVAIRQCPYFNDLLDNSPIPRPRNVITIIRDHQCGFRRNMPFVCCNRPTTAAPETTTEITTQPPVNNNLNRYPDPPVTIDRFSDPLPHHRNYHLLPQDICGAIKTDFRITNGDKASLNEYPWMALLFYKSSDGVVDFRCGGTLINERYVLTAAHCVLNQPIFGVRLGEYDVETQTDCESNTGYCAPPTQDFMIEKIVIHPSYNAKIFSNDIAIIKLKGEANFHYENVQPICLPVESELTSRSAIVSGWGVTEDGYKSQVLLEARLPILPLSDCQKLYKSFASITRNQICAGGVKGRDTCGGDSGGPLKDIGDVNGSSRYIQYGIVSFGPRFCGADGKPGIYTKVSSYMNWILDHLEEY
ncbi:unnamed protein product [Psylliodes chrysocephalus]|uniref:CLIP domain-containing serine protease n=1 Tax=Psylliodes chrysocephalus TaxID=3402493 RepID=A0A9P0CPA5_9CUCU|nr:unnamed protein product [Psylliodes chrysocephala]